MTTATTTTGIRRTIGRAKQVWSELDYAQRRLLEIRTGVPFTERGERRRPEPTSVEELEELYALEQQQPRG